MPLPIVPAPTTPNTRLSLLITFLSTDYTDCLKRNLCNLWMVFLSFNRHRDRIPTTKTQRTHSTPRIPSLQLVKHRRHQTPSTLPDRMAPPHRAAIHVILLRIESELAGN